MRHMVRTIRYCGRCRRVQTEGFLCVRCMCVTVVQWVVIGTVVLLLLQLVV